MQIHHSGCILAAVPFYLKQKFVSLTDDDEGSDTRLLYFDLKDIAGVR